MRINISKMNRWKLEDLMKWYEQRGFTTHIICKPSETFLTVFKVV